MIYFTTELYQIFKDQVILMLLKLPQKRKRSKRPNSFHGSIIGTPYRTSPQVKFLNRAPPSFIISTQQSTSEFDNTLQENTCISHYNVVEAFLTVVYAGKMYTSPKLKTLKTVRQDSKVSWLAIRITCRCF